jgi:CheY-like chemotaxis protein
MDDRDPFAPLRFPSAARPLLGLTVLLVEDSRFASEAMRLLCMRSGARIRRADCLRSARRHLQVYRPSVLIVDVGLPDGSGAELIAEAAQASPRIGLILGISGDDHRRDACIAAGADGFLEKPLHSIASFQELILSHLPQDHQPPAPRELRDEKIVPDTTAYPMWPICWPRARMRACWTMSRSFLKGSPFWQVTARCARPTNPCARRGRRDNRSGRIWRILPGSCRTGLPIASLSDRPCRDRALVISCSKTQMGRPVIAP